MAIRSYGDEVTRMLYQECQAPMAVPADVARRARRYLTQLDAADDLDLLRAVPALRNVLWVEGDVVTLAVGAGYRVTFLWRDGSAWFVRLLEDADDDER